MAFVRSFWTYVNSRHKKMNASVSACVFGVIIYDAIFCEHTLALLWNGDGDISHSLCRTKTKIYLLIHTRHLRNKY